VSPPGK
jgi:hypothetical protein